MVKITVYVDRWQKINMLGKDLLQLWYFLVFKFREHVKCCPYLLLVLVGVARTSGGEPGSGQDAALSSFEENVNLDSNR